MGTERRLPILYVVQSGNPEFERFMITNQDDEFWNGQHFAANATLYATHNEAATVAQNILKSHFQGIAPVKYVVPLFIEVFSDEPVSGVRSAADRSQEFEDWGWLRYLAGDCGRSSAS